MQRSTRTIPTQQYFAACLRFKKECGTVEIMKHDVLICLRSDKYLSNISCESHTWFFTSSTSQRRRSLRPYIPFPARKNIDETGELWRTWSGTATVGTNSMHVRCWRCFCARTKGVMVFRGWSGVSHLWSPSILHRTRLSWQTGAKGS